MKSASQLVSLVTGMDRRAHPARMRDTYVPHASGDKKYEDVSILLSCPVDGDTASYYKKEGWRRAIGPTVATTTPGDGSETLDQINEVDANGPATATDH